MPPHRLLYNYTIVLHSLCAKNKAGIQRHRHGQEHAEIEKKSVLRNTLVIL